MGGFAPDLLKDKVAVVTGAGTGIGRATALALASHGAVVALAARQQDRLDDAAREIAARGGRALAVACDVSEPEQVAAAFARVDEEFGRVDILVNNAAANFIRPSEML